MWERIAAVLREGDHFLVTSHINLDGDAICSTLALHLLLKDMGKASRWALVDVPAPEFSFLYEQGELERLQNSTSLEDVRVICALDIPSWQRLGDVAERIERLQATKICLDHHPREGSLVDLEVRDMAASATGVLVYRLIEYMGLSLSPPVARAIYTGILTDTMSFRLANTNPECHQVASACIRAGADPADIYKRIYGTLSVSRLKLAAEALSTLRITPDGRIAYMYLTREMYQRANAKGGDDEDLVEFARSVEGVDIAIFLREQENGRIRMSWRARDDADVSVLARQFGGGGHLRAAGADTYGSLDDVLQEALARATAYLQKTDTAVL